MRSPLYVSVRFAEGAPTTATTLRRALTRGLLVSWAPERTPRVRQAFGHVVVTSTDEQSGEVAMGFRAQLPTGLGWIGEHALSLLVVWPLVVVLIAGLSRLAGRRDDPLVRRAVDRRRRSWSCCWRAWSYRQLRARLRARRRQRRLSARRAMRMGAVPRRRVVRRRRRRRASCWSSWRPRWGSWPCSSTASAAGRTRTTPRWRCSLSAVVGSARRARSRAPLRGVGHGAGRLCGPRGRLGRRARARAPRRGSGSPAASGRPR